MKTYDVYYLQFGDISSYQCCHMPFKHAFSFANVNMLIFIAAELLERMKCVMKWQSAENTLDVGFKRRLLNKHL